MKFMIVDDLLVCCRIGVMLISLWWGFLSFEILIFVNLITALSLRSLD
jgi:hypothetical protein